MLGIMLGLLPGIIFFVIFYLLDRDKKNINLTMLLATFIFGCISSYLAYRLEWHFGSYFKEMEESNIIEVFIYALFGVAIFEEGLKLFFSFVFSRLNKVKSLTNNITYCVATACGFLAFENVAFYFMKYGVDASITRLFTASPSHICFGIIMGFILYKVNKFDIKSIFFLFIAFLVPSLLHAFYNTCLYQNIDYLRIYSYVFLVILVIICIFIIIKEYFLKKD